MQQWRNKITKYLTTETTILELAYMSYKKWRPDNTWPEVSNAGCGVLTYSLVYKSWSEAWEDNDIILRPEDEESYLGSFGA